jgi:hypothetical protein
MPWRRETNYHGSREYAPDDAPAGAFTAWIKRLFGKLLRWGAPPPAMPLMYTRDLERQLTKLWPGGLSQRSGQRARKAGLSDHRQ